MVYSDWMKFGASLKFVVCTVHPRYKGVLYKGFPRYKGVRILIPSDRVGDGQTTVNGQTILGDGQTLITPWTSKYYWSMDYSSCFNSTVDYSTVQILTCIAKF